MTKMFMLINFCLFLVSSVMANDLILSNTGNAQLDGVYKPFVEINGAMSFIKNTDGVMFKVERFKFSTDNREILGWMIVDSNNKEYYAVTDERLQIPTQGWDIGRAGVGLNVNFDLTFRDTAQPVANNLTLTNASSTDIRVYPNPTIGAITVEAQGLQNLSLLNASGQIIMESQNNSLDLSNLPGGIYNLIVEANDVKTVKRIVKNQ